MASSTEANPTGPGVVRDSLEGRSVVVGEVLFDHFPDGSRVLGGAPFNVAWHLCAFGSDPILVSAVGHDEEGREVFDLMEGWGLSTGGVAVLEDRPTGRVEVTIGDEGPEYAIPPGQAWDALPLPELPDGTPALLCHGTLALRTPDALARCLELRERLGAPVLVDLNLRAPWWSGELVARVLEGVEWVKASDAELAELLDVPTTSVAECIEAGRALLRTHGVGQVVVTRGAQGSVLVHDGHEVVAPAVETAEVVDTVGAGDAFTAVVAHGLTEGWGEADLLDRASRFAADVCTIRGATNHDFSMYERHLRRWSEPPASVGEEAGLHVLSLSLHGLVRGTDIELGRDADTGGQVSYVVDQARALAEHRDVATVTLVTRLVEDRNLDDSYAVPEEDLGGGARIVRLPFGPRRYLRKETLWPYLDALVDQAMRWFRTREADPPDLVHGHYADAGYVGAQLSKLLGVPLLFTGHSLGRVKKERLLADGVDEDTIEERYRITRRIEAEEQALEVADLVFASTRQEVREQFQRYDHYEPERMRVVPPGVDLGRFSPPPPEWEPPPAVEDLERFLKDPDKPAIFAIARPDERKNFGGLIRAYASLPELRERANLLLVAGTRDDIREMDPGPRRVFNQILHLIDAHDLYGSVAYPKTHRPSDVPDFYRYAARTKGLFVNAALTEPFGLTLLEAAATGLPVVATNDGGPRDILDACGHGLLADPLDTAELARAMLEALSSAERWGRWSKSGVAHVHERFSWASHAASYVEGAKQVLAGTRPASLGQGSGLLDIDRLLVTDLDDTLTGDDEALQELVEAVDGAGPSVGFGIATGRSLDEAQDILGSLDLRSPDLIVTTSGTEIHYGARLIQDRSWERQIRHRWEPDLVRDTLDGLSALTLEEDGCTAYRLRYRVEPDDAPKLAEVRRALRRAGAKATVMLDHGTVLDVVPVRASPGLALRFFGFKWNLEPGRILVAGDSGNDADMIAGDTLGVVVGNHTGELDELVGHPRVYFAEGGHARGVLEGIDHYDFFGTITTEDLHSDDR